MSFWLRNSFIIQWKLIFSSLSNHISSLTSCFFYVILSLNWRSNSIFDQIRTLRWRQKGRNSFFSSRNCFLFRTFVPKTIKDEINAFRLIKFKRYYKQIFVSHLIWTNFSKWFEYKDESFSRKLLRREL